jgi:DNA polymerase V
VQSSNTMKIEKLYSNSELTFYKPICETSIKISLVSSRINAGFPSPAMDFAEEQIDLNEELIKNPYSTFFVRVAGESMRNAGIYNGDLLVIDKSIEPTNGKIAICCLNGEFTVKRLLFEKDKITLIAENESFASTVITKEHDFEIWGVVTHAIKKV